MLKLIQQFMSKNDVVGTWLVTMPVTFCVAYLDFYDWLSIIHLVTLRCLLRSVLSVKGLLKDAVLPCEEKLLKQI